ncbi:MAG TPA: response regulator [Vicinamibacterales bacterium]|jgi:CheY-like chemotaxis protein
MAGARVLVVDDDENIRLLFSRALKLEGYDVGVAQGAEEALSLIRGCRPSAIFLDLKMPYVNGAGFLFRLREDPDTRDIPVAIITGVSNMPDSQREELRALGAQICYKPLSIDEIAQVARTLLGAGA